MIHGLADARQALGAVLQAGRRHATLLSAPAAACYMGPAWWRALVAAASSEHPGLAVTDLLDCDDAAGRAVEALRLGQRQLILSASCPQRGAILERAAPLGALVHASRPVALDLADRDAGRRLAAWLLPSGPGPMP